MSQTNAPVIKVTGLTATTGLRPITDLLLETIFLPVLDSAFDYKCPTIK